MSAPGRCCFSAISKVFFRRFFNTESTENTQPPEAFTAENAESAEPPEDFTTESAVFDPVLDPEGSDRREAQTRRENTEEEGL